MINLFKTVGFLVAGSLLTGSTMAQKKVSELTLVYNFSLVMGDQNTKPGYVPDNVTYTVYIKGNKSRTEMASNAYFTATIFDARSNTAVMLKELSGQKLLIRMSTANLAENNKRYEGITFTNTNETKEIAGYKCVKAEAQRSDGYTLTVYYTKDLIADNKDYDPQFKNLDGIPLEYELTNGAVKILYTVSRLNLNPVPASKFDIPKSGYREMTYDESRKMNGAGG